MKGKITAVVLWLFVIGSFGYLGLHSFIWYKKSDIQAQAQVINKDFHPGKWIFNTSCVGCHNFDGRAKPSTPHVPRLHGQHKDYLVAQINDIMEGRRTGNLVDHMKIALPSMSAEEIEQMAEYLESIGEYKPTQQ